ncbi:DNA-(apurinic or apyrimidinic site) lyase /endonuclease III [Archaeoglobus sulfaticallidus PM70-1]|uniref:Endonuclease III n=1 Tax=Archaeoglobus sulfaticallidus PM70-1 TaxID=387631 RepID=N0BMU2_9EURY|nr:endonuclease III [Archaeoglobus sulfaticallidus]AGK61580.1 DNA-(apurinic or apyrimidinic site) lyase /endonuclease III [Archaeoglobus sulfaticallidus PM70-1]
MSAQEISKRIDWDRLLEAMESEGFKRKAPVLTLKRFLNTPFQHLVFTILSARTRDEQTAKAVENLFKVVSTPKDLAKLEISEIERLIKSTGFYRNKAKNLKAMAEVLVREYNSKVPDDFDELLKLPGVGRKTANVVLASAFNRNTIGVDTHVHRISNRLGLVNTSKPEDTEIELKKIVPERYWRRVNKAFVAFGQTVCKPVKPLCEECPINDICPKIGVKL